MTVGNQCDAKIRYGRPFEIKKCKIAKFVDINLKTF